MIEILDHRIAYISRAVSSLSDAQLAALAHEAAASNAALGITGCLLYDGQGFLQAIEGPAGPVSALFDRIRQDPRHDAIEVMNDQPIKARAFGHRPLGWQAVDPGCCRRAFMDGVNAGVVRIADPQLRALFIGFAALDADRRG